MKARFVTALYNLTISASLNRGEKIDEHTFITNNQTVAGALVPPNANVAIGELEADSIRNSSAVIYANQVVPSNMPPAKFLLKKLAQVSGFLNSIWIYRDNSVNIELGFLISTLDGVFKVDCNSL